MFSTKVCGHCIEDWKASGDGKSFATEIKNVQKHALADIASSTAKLPKGIWALNKEVLRTFSQCAFGKATLDAIVCIFKCCA